MGSAFKQKQHITWSDETIQSYIEKQRIWVPDQRY